MTTSTQPQLGVVESPDLAFALTLMGYSVIGGGTFREAAMTIRSHESDAPLPVIVANMAGTGLRSWVSRQEQMGSRVVVLRTEPDGPIPEGVGTTVSLPLSVNDVMALAGWGASGHPLGSATIAVDFTIADVAAYRPVEAPVAEPVTPALQAAPSFEVAPAPVVEVTPTVEPAPVFERPEIIASGDDDVPDWARTEFNLPQPVSAFANREAAAEPIEIPADEGDDDEEPSYPEPLTANPEPVHMEPVAETAPVAVVQTAPLLPAFATPAVAEVTPAIESNLYVDVEPAPAVAVPAVEKTFEQLIAEQQVEAAPVQSAPMPVAPQQVAEPVDFDQMVNGYSNAVPAAPAPAVVQPTPEPVHETDFDSMVKSATYGANVAAAQSLPQPVAEPIAQPVEEPVAAPIAQPIAAPIAEPVAPVAQAFAAPVEVPADLFAQAPATMPTPPAPAQPPVAFHTMPAPSPSPVIDFSASGQTIISFAGKGGVGKTTCALAMAHRAAAAGLRVAVVDMNRGQGDIRSYLRLADQNMPSIYNAAVTGRPEAAVIPPDQVALARPGLAPLGFAVVLAPPADLADPSMVTASVYAEVINLLQQKTDLVIIDTQITESRDTSGLIDNLVVPMLLGGAWGLGVTDMSNPGLNNLLARTKDFVTRGVPRERLLLTVNKSAGFGASDHVSIDQVFSAYATFVGAAGDDLGFANQMNVGNIDSSNPTIGPVIDAALLRITGRDDFAPAAPRKRRLFGRSK